MQTERKIIAGLRTTDGMWHFGDEQFISEEQQLFKETFEKFVADAWPSDSHEYIEIEAEFGELAGEKSRENFIRSIRGALGRVASGERTCKLETVDIRLKITAPGSNDSNPDETKVGEPDQSETKVSFGSTGDVSWETVAQLNKIPVDLLATKSELQQISQTAIHCAQLGEQRERLNKLVSSLAGVSFEATDEGMLAGFQLVNEIQQAVFLDTASSLLNEGEPVFLIRSLTQIQGERFVAFRICDAYNERELRNELSFPNLEIVPRLNADSAAILARLYLERKREAFRLRLTGLCGNKIDDRGQIRALVSELNRQKQLLGLEFEFDGSPAFLRATHTSFVVAPAGRGAPIISCTRGFPKIRVVESEEGTTVESE